MDRGPISLHSAREREGRRACQGRTVRAAYAGESRRGPSVHQFDHNRVRSHTGERVADEVAIDRQGNQTIGRDQTRAAAD